MVALMGETWDAIDWAGLQHNYGSAEDVPALLRRCEGPDPEDAEAAADDLLNLLFHQGGWICSAASAALPFLLRMAADSSVPIRSRSAVLEIVAQLAAESGTVVERFLDPGWESAWQRVSPALLALLSDPEPGIRRGAAYALGVCADPGECALPALLARWQTEDDAVTRLDLILALGQVVLRSPVGTRAEETIDLLGELLGSPEPQLRLAATHALAAGDPSLPARRLDLVLEEIRDPSVDLWRHTSSMECGPAGVQQCTVMLLSGPSPRFVLGLLADHPDDRQRSGALGQAGALLSQWRSPTAELLDPIAARLADAVPEVRFRAAELLACLGTSAAPLSDDVAALLDDTATRPTRRGEAVFEAALWALARMNDRRCVPQLRELLAGDGSGFAGIAAAHSAAAWHYPALPSLAEALAQLADHAELLLPAVCSRLDTTTDPRRVAELCGVLTAWGPAAVAAVPQLTDLLEDDHTWAPAAQALAHIGARCPQARNQLQSRMASGGKDSELAAWAYWKLGGEPEPVVEVVGSAAVTGAFPRFALERLADLGPHAAGYADRLHAMTDSPEPWTSVGAAHALWAATDDTRSTVPALVEAVQGLAEGTYLPVMLPAVRALTRMGHAAGPAARLLAVVPLREQRLRWRGGWQGFAEDEAIRAAVEELLSACG